MKLYKSLHQVEVVRRPLIWDIAPEISNFAIFGFYLENCERQMFNVNCETDQHYKFYQPANVQQNRTTGVGVMAPEISVFTYSCIFGYYLEIYRRQNINLNCKFEQHDKVFLPGIIWIIHVQAIWLVNPSTLIVDQKWHWQVVVN